MTPASEILTRLMSAAEGVLTELDALVTADPTLAIPALAEDKPVVMFTPPDLEFMTWHITEYKWDVWIMSPHRDDPPAALEQITQILDLLIVPLELDSARPDSFSGPTGHHWPGYITTITMEE